MKFYVRFNSALWIVNARSLNEAKKKADEIARKQEYASTGLCIEGESDHILTCRHCCDVNECRFLGIKDKDPIRFPRDRFYLRDWN